MNTIDKKDLEILLFSKFDPGHRFDGTREELNREVGKYVAILDICGAGGKGLELPLAYIAYGYGERCFEENYEVKLLRKDLDGRLSNLVESGLLKKTEDKYSLI